MELVIISGMSGAGKSKAVGALEDVGYYCVDNIPPKIMPIIAGLYRGSDTDIQKLAVVVDARSREMFSDLGQILTEMRESRIPYRILFLDASTEVLLQRYKETRRRHPLMDGETVTLSEAIETERELLGPLRETADLIIDTSRTLPSQLRERVIGVVSEQSAQPMTITLLSFGFRNGLPPEADLVFDVRCLPNPFYIQALRDHTGNEPCVRDYVMGFPQSRELTGKLEDLLAFSVPLYIREGKSHLTIAVGCTGGRHRSVVVAERLGAFLKEQGYRVAVSHRDRDKGRYGSPT